MKIIPLGDRVLVRPHTREQTTASGIVLPDTAEKEQKEQGDIVAIGSGTGVKKLKLAVGNVVVFGKYSGDEIEVDGEDYKFLKDEDILGIVE